MEEAGVVDGDGLLLAGQLVFAFLDEGLGHGGDLVDTAVEPHRGIDAVREQVACDARARRLRIQTPQRRAALRQIRVDGPVLQEVGAVVEDAAEPTLVDQLLGEGDSGCAAVVVPNRVGDAGLLDRCDHWLGFGRVTGDGLLAENHLAGFGGRDGDRRVGVVGRADVDRVDIVTRDQGFPIGLDRLVLPLACKFLCLVFAAAANGLKNRAGCEVREEVVNALVAVGVGPAHEAVADEADA